MDAQDMEQGAGATTVRSAALEPVTLAGLVALYADYSAALADRRFDDWVELFTDDCLYLLQPRENHDRGLPLATMRLEGKGMLKDRAYGVAHTLFHAPYYQRHVFGLPRLLGSEAAADGSPVLRIEIACSVFRTRPGDVSEVFSVGRHLDRVVRDPADASRWIFSEKKVVFDSEMILNSVIYPL
jgi:salicylate 5-hydroxylase small subunit